MALAGAYAGGFEAGVRGLSEGDEEGVPDGDVGLTVGLAGACLAEVLCGAAQLKQENREISGCPWAVSTGPCRDTHVSVISSPLNMSKQARKTAG